MSLIAKRLEDLGIKLPHPAAPVANYVPFTPVSYTHLDVYKRQQGAAGTVTEHALAHILELSFALHRHLDWLVYGRGRTSTVGRVRSSSDGTGSDTDADLPHGVGVAVRLLRRVCPVSYTHLIVGTAMAGSAASRFSRSSYFRSPSARPSRQR